jgi:hypothetical protein
MNVQQGSFDFSPAIAQALPASPPGSGAGTGVRAKGRNRRAQSSVLDRPVRQHLRAAQKLSRAIRAQKLDRQRQRATGMAILDHLLACLEAQEAREANATQASRQP